MENTSNTFEFNTSGKKGLNTQEMAELTVLFMMTDFVDAPPSFYYDRRRILMIKATEDQKHMAFVDAYGLHGEKLYEGICRCFKMPMGEDGLEGYILDHDYRFERMKKVNVYYRVYPNADDPTYYETCGEHEFRRYFSIQRKL